MGSGRGGHPHIEVEAVLTHLSVRIPHLTALEARERRVYILIAGIGVFLGLVYSGPWTLGFRRTETALPYRGLAKGDAQKSSDVALVWHWQADAPNPTSVRLHNQVSLRLRRAGGDGERQEDDGGEEEKHRGLHLWEGKRSVTLKLHRSARQATLWFLSDLQRRQRQESNGIMVQQRDGEQTGRGGRNEMRNGTRN